MVEVKPINLFFSLNQHSPGLSVRSAISPTLTEEFIIHPSVYSEIKKLGHAKSDVLLNENESSLGAYAYPSIVSVSSVIKNSSYDLPHVKNFNIRNDLSSLIKDYKCNKIKSTKLKLSIIREKCSDIVLCKKVKGAMKMSSVNFNTPSPMESKHRRFAMLRRIFEPWQWKRREKRDRFEQTSRTLERKISMRSTKELIKKRRSYACETQCSLSVPSFLYVSDSPLVSMKKEKRKTYRCGQHTAQLSETVTETFELVKVEPKNFKTLEKERKRKGERRRFARRRSRREFMETHLLE
ncbi:phosphatase and actin regulator 2 [Trichonephila clavipes]|nr:phosphatase and actin regulator 2 [Trichonephila clavipes]